MYRIICPHCQRKTFRIYPEGKEPEQSELPFPDAIWCWCAIMYAVQEPGFEKLAINACVKE